MTSTEAAGIEAFDPFELSDSLVFDVRDPHARVQAMRPNGPVQEGSPFSAKAIALLGGGVYSVLGADEVERVLRDGETFSSTVYEDVMGVVMGHSLIEMDGAEHRGHRALVSHAFRQKLLERWETELVQAVVDELIDRFAGRGRAELVRELTFVFPVWVIARLLGLPREDYTKFQRWSIELLSVMYSWDRGMAASQALRGYFAGVLAARRREPADDIITDLAEAEIDGERLTDDAIFAFLRLLLPAGVETTYRSSGNLLVGLLRDPHQLAAVRADRSLVPAAIEEGLRWEPPITSLLRVVTRDAELAGVAIPKGAIVNVCVGAANRDPARYAEPDRFDVHRTDRGHLTFGFGPHVCLGMHLARMETRVALTALLDHFPDLRLDPAADVPEVQGVAMRSPMAIPVVF